MNRAEILALKQKLIVASLGDGYLRLPQDQVEYLIRLVCTHLRVRDLIFDGGKKA